MHKRISWNWRIEKDIQSMYVILNIHRKNNTLVFIWFFLVFNSDFEEDIKGEAEGSLERLYRSIATGDRPTGTSVDQGLADAEAKEIYDVSQIISSIVILWLNFKIFYQKGWRR